ncbi:unnamed protein product [Clavelina lepadiformis]|uniref:Uncharacterized protein n=1 Tax=Clavelina lepadiformis TaxID=159417 RepID=A0ABP0F3L1_CLALP
MSELLEDVDVALSSKSITNLRQLGDKSDKILAIASTFDKASAQTYHNGHNNATSPAYSEDKLVTSDTDSDNYIHINSLMVTTQQSVVIVPTITMLEETITESDVIKLAGKCLTRMIEAEETTTRSGHRHNRSPGNSNHPPEHQTTRTNVTINDASVQTRANVKERANTGPLGRSRETDIIDVEGIT